MVTGTDGLGAFRRATREMLIADFDVAVDTADDVILALSELLTNACEHAGVDEIPVTIRVTPTAVTIDVSYPDDAPVPGVGPMPEASAVRGRGLALVAAVSDAFTTTWNEGLTSIACVIRQPQLQL
jgi:anti-sigma regulatory factor (Ser/Thr protein kinase)